MARSGLQVRQTGSELPQREISGDLALPSARRLGFQASRAQKRRVNKWDACVR